MTPAEKFHAVVQWLHDDVVKDRSAPGLIIGLSGTDSVVAFLAAYRALDRANKAHRLMGVHFAPSEDFLAIILRLRSTLGSTRKSFHGFVSERLWQRL